MRFVGFPSLLASYHASSYQHYNGHLTHSTIQMMFWCFPIHVFAPLNNAACWQSYIHNRNDWRHASQITRKKNMRTVCNVWRTYHAQSSYHCYCSYIDLFASVYCIQIKWLKLQITKAFIWLRKCQPIKEKKLQKS